MDKHPDLVNALKAVRADRGFDVAAWVDQKTDMFNDYMRKCGLSACVVSVSGGVDSGVTLALAKHAQKKENSPIKKVLGVAQPIHSTGEIWKRALECREALDAEVIVVDQTEVHNSLTKIVGEATGIEGKGFADGQLRSYMRTPVGYYVAQLLSQEGTPCVVLGTGNFDEDGYLLYFCKAGDGVVDVQLIADLHKSEVFTVGHHLNVPKSILEAAPSADLWEGQTDEEELGFAYDFVELYTQYLMKDEEGRKAFKAGFNADALKYFDETCVLVDKVHNRNKHKLNSPVNINILKTLAV
eukprot:TRINITY_DN11_c0_g1_i1.p2 TRINITY_DN11_c0_g1~~TRINITY_DN11_c0_g1_i1.p2  ORF type:complete len:298 (+),score=90.83 TRINITY_DN11_c0_g1_i1:237-1130(+)